MNENLNETAPQPENEYAPPAIVYETVISTRAGSPIIEGDAPQPPTQEDSIDLFPSD